MKIYTLLSFIGAFFPLMCSVSAQDPNLIDVDNLEQLNAIRYDLDGDGRADEPADVAEHNAAFGTLSCVATSSCEGYELTTDLDFDDTDAVATDEQSSKWSEECTTDCVTEEREDDDGAGNITVVPVNVGWDPIGKGTAPYTATFEGNGHTISNLFIDRSSNYMGLFGRVSGGAIRNLSLEEGNVMGGSSTGVLAGYIENSTIVETCYSTGSVDGANNVGGLLGYLRSRSSVRESYSTASIGGNFEVGGLLGFADGSSTITSCYATGDVNGIPGSDHVGGLVGHNKSSTITSSYATGDVICGGWDAGGLVGRASGSTSTVACYATGNVSSESASELPEGSAIAGGLLGNISGNVNVTACYATGNVTTIGGFATSGGLIGQIGMNSNAKVIACYATGNASSSGRTVGPNTGGLVGTINISLNRSRVIITACYATGNATAAQSSFGFLSILDNAYSGGLVGSAGRSYITACYATGNARSTARGPTYAGGLVGRSGGAQITACYAIGDVFAASREAGSEAGGILGSGAPSTRITRCYYRSESTITGGTSSTDGTPQIQSALQTPTSGTGIYSLWVRLELDKGNSAGIDDRTKRGDSANDLVWDFGTNMQYPALKVDFDANPDAVEKATVAEFGAQRQPISFEQDTYNFVVGPVPGAVVGTVIAYPAALTYSIVSQKLNEDAPITSDFAFDITIKDVRGRNSGELTVATGITLTISDVYTLEIQTSDGTNTDMAEVRIEVVSTPPATVDDLSARAVSAAEIELSWTAPADGGAEITGYKLQWHKNGEAVFAQEEADIAGDATSFAHRGLEQGTEYHYRLIAINEIGESAPSNEASATTHSVPAAVDDLSARAVSKAVIELSWTAPADGGAEITGYKLQWHKNGEAVFAQEEADIASDATSFAHRGLEQGTEYHYRLIAINEIGESAPSNEASATTHSVPAAVDDLSARAVSKAVIELSWTAPADGGAEITGYKLQWHKNGEAVFAQEEADIAGDATSFAHRGLEQGTEYHYRLIAINEIGESAPSNEASATTHSVPAAVDDLSARAVSKAEIELSWTAPADGGAEITGYKLQWHKNGEAVFAQEEADIAGDATSFAHRGLEQGTEYHYRLIAINEIGESAPSNEVSATTQGAPSIFIVPSSEEAARAYPNPTSGVVRFWGLSATRKYVYKVYSLMGQKMLVGVLRSNKLDVSSLVNGQYALVVEGEGNKLLRIRLLVLK